MQAHSSLTDRILVGLYLSLDDLSRRGRRLRAQEEQGCQLPGVQRCVAVIRIAITRPRDTTHRLGTHPGRLCVWTGADLIVWMTNFLTLHPKPPTGNEWREVYARVDTEREPLVQRRPGDDPVSESIYLSPPRGARGEPDHGDADPHSENTPLLLCVELLNAGYFDHTKDSAASMTFTPDAQYALQVQESALPLPVSTSPS